MPSLLNTTVAANYLKTSPSTQFGTRKLRTIAVTIDNSGSNDKDLTKQTGSTGAYTDSNSYYSAAIRALQLSAEIYAVYTPSATAFVALVADLKFSIRLFNGFPSIWSICFGNCP